MVKFFESNLCRNLVGHISIDTITNLPYIIYTYRQSVALQLSSHLQNYFQNSTQIQHRCQTHPLFQNSNKLQYERFDSSSNQTINKFMNRKTEKTMPKSSSSSSFSSSSFLLIVLFVHCGSWTCNDFPASLWVHYQLLIHSSILNIQHFSALPVSMLSLVFPMASYLMYAFTLPFSVPPSPPSLITCSNPCNLLSYYLYIF